jgi:hypothetical protein
VQACRNSCECTGIACDVASPCPLAVGTCGGSCP